MIETLLEDYITFLSFKTISADKGMESEMEKASRWLKKKLEESFLEVEIWKTEGPPIIFAKNLEAGEGKPTLLIYNHYDVQPVDPLELWESDPFTAKIEGDLVFARGAQDNKGQCLYTIKALKEFLKKNPKNVNIKLLIEGEEESGSFHLSKLLAEKKEALKADTLAIVDLSLKSIERPAISLGVRGILTCDVVLTGSHTDLHSGQHGGIVYNPLHALVKILSELRDEEGKILIPGFYDDVRPLSDEEKKHLALDFDEKEYLDVFGAVSNGGEKAFSPSERVGARPTLEINGLSGGYSGEGFKTVIPAKAFAKLSCRLVGNQDPQKIGEALKKSLIEKTPKGIQIEVTLHEGAGQAIRANPTSQGAKSFKKAFETVFQKPCESLLQGGSIPIVSKLAKASGAEVILLGLGLPGDQIHAPNEHFSISRLEKGFLVILEALKNF
jgi:acetylornithine deacetylase/succinyl-diaminopimelate desuccinylase-like protein